MNRRWLIGAATAVAVLQIGFLVSMIAGRAAVLRNGEVVTLEVHPVDPRDLLRGDYVILSYNISSVAAELFEENPDGDGRSTVYVRLRAGEEGIWKAVAARYGDVPQAPAEAGDIDIRGEASASWSGHVTDIWVTYGIERFYVPEGEGRAIETDLRERPFRMRVAVASDGAAQIKSFHDGDRMLYAEPLY